jgi:hypothetical protein
MMLGELIEWAVEENWSRAWVVFRALVLIVLVLVFKTTFVHLINWYAHWKASGITRELQHAFPVPSAAP